MNKQCPSTEKITKFLINHTVLKLIKLFRTLTDFQTFQLLDPENLHEITFKTYTSCKEIVIVFVMRS